MDRHTHMHMPTHLVDRSPAHHGKLKRSLDCVIYLGQMFAIIGGHVAAVLLGQLAALSENQPFMQINTEITGLAEFQPLT